MNQVPELFDSLLHILSLKHKKYLRCTNDTIIIIVYTWNGKWTFKPSINE